MWALSEHQTARVKTQADTKQWCEEGIPELSVAFYSLFAAQLYPPLGFHKIPLTYNKLYLFVCLFEVTEIGCCL